MHAVTTDAGAARSCEPSACVTPSVRPPVFGARFPTGIPVVDEARDPTVEPLQTQPGVSAQELAPELPELHRHPPRGGVAPVSAEAMLEEIALSLNSPSKRDVEAWCRSLAVCAGQWQPAVDHAGLAARIAQKVRAFPPRCRDSLADTCATQLHNGLRSAMPLSPATVRGYADTMLLLVSADVIPALVVLRAVAWLSDDPRGPGVGDALVEFTDALTRRSLGDLRAAVPLLAHGLQAARKHAELEARDLIDLSLGKLRLALRDLADERFEKRERYVEQCRAVFEQARACYRIANNRDRTPDQLLNHLFFQVARFGASIVPLADLCGPTGAGHLRAYTRAAESLEIAGFIRRVFGNTVAVAFCVQEACDAPVAVPMPTRAILARLSQSGPRRTSGEQAFASTDGNYTTAQVNEAIAAATASGLLTITAVDADGPTAFTFSVMPRPQLVLSTQEMAAAMRSGVRAGLAGLGICSPQAAAFTVARLIDSLERFAAPRTKLAADLKALAVSIVFAALPESTATSQGDSADVTAAARAAAFVACLTGSSTDESAAALLRTSIPHDDVSKADPAYDAAMRRFNFSGLVVACLVRRGLASDTVAIDYLRWAARRDQTAHAYQCYTHALTLASELTVLRRLTAAEFDAHAAWLEEGRRLHEEQSPAFWAVRFALECVNDVRQWLANCEPDAPAGLPTRNATPAVPADPQNAAALPALPSVPPASPPESPSASPLRRDPKEIWPPEAQGTFPRSPLKLRRATLTNTARQPGVTDAKTAARAAAPRKISWALDCKSYSEYFETRCVRIWPQWELASDSQASDDGTTTAQPSIPDALPVWNGDFVVLVPLRNDAPKPSSPNGCPAMP